MSAVCAPQKPTKKSLWRKSFASHCFPLPLPVPAPLMGSSIFDISLFLSFMTTLDFRTKSLLEDRRSDVEPLLTSFGAIASMKGSRSGTGPLPLSRRFRPRARTASNRRGWKKCCYEKELVKWISKHSGIARTSFHRSTSVPTVLGRALPLLTATISEWLLDSSLEII